ncbi:hypothetical protein U9M48_039152 [Paspalum notatum var. saurae]|uniref:Uncharacterized protein n=1 Tax=Paspalum notatum var. saurae TaxID=547442 RepID=A0AAQ3XCW9_PASNO
MSRDWRAAAYLGGHPVYVGNPRHDRVDGAVYVVGDFFLTGATGGSAFHFVSGLRASAAGASGVDRVAGALRAVCSNVPRFAGSCAAYSAAFIVVDNVMSLARGKDDNLNMAIASAATAGLYGAMRRGGGAAAARCALLGVTGFLIYKGIDYAMDHANARWDIIDHKRKIGRGEPTQVSMAARRTAAPEVTGDDDSFSGNFA